MAPDGGQTGEEVSTVITCEGTLGHPEFSRQFQTVVDRLNGILGVPVKVRKLEPWNSVRVTLSVPREAALRLRQLAQQGAPQLRALGILSVQLDGEGAISLRLQGANGEPQEVILRTTQDGSAGGSGSGAAGGNSQVQFKSPNVVCPSDSVVPRVGVNMGPPQSVIPSNSINNKSPFAGPFPFASMNQAIHSQSSNGNGSTSVSRSTTNMDPPPPPFLPPPYPGIRQSSNAATVQPAVTISSPLLVNLLQNDQQGPTTSVPNSTTARHNMRAAPSVKATGTKLKNNFGTQFTNLPVPGQGQILAPPSGTAAVPHQSRGSTANHLVVSATTSQANNVLVNSSNNNLSSSSVSSSSPSPTCALSTSIALASSTSSHVDASSAIQSIATSLANSVTNNSSVAGLNRQTGIFGMSATPKGPTFTGQRYQRTPQGSIIAVNKPLPTQAQNAGATNQSGRTNLPLVQAQSAPAILRQKNVFGHTLSHQSQTKMHVNTNNVVVSSGSNNNNSHVTVKSHAVTHAHIGIMNSRNGQGVVTAQHNQIGLGLAQSESLVTQVISAEPAVTNVVKKPLPSPPPYSVAITRNWETLMGNAASSLLDLAPSLTDLKPDELDELLPTLDQDALPELSELELLGTALNSETASALNDDHPPPKSNNGQDSEAEFTAMSMLTSHQSSNVQMDGRKFLINPLTGELEPHSGGEDSDVEDVKDVFTGLPSPLGLSDEDTNSTSRLDTATDQSDSETRSSTEGKHSRVKNSKIRREGRDSPAQKEKIKLRLKLEKNDQPINPAYKVDVSFVNSQQPKRASTSSAIPGPPVTLTGASGSEELRVPPLHISLRGRNSAVIKNKTKLNPDGTPMVKKTRKLQSKAKREGASEQDGSTTDSGEHKRIKKFKANHEHKQELLSDMPGSPGNNSLSKYSTLHNHYKEKQKERRGSDSDLVRTGKKHDANGALMPEDKRRRLSQSESDSKRLEDDCGEEATTPSILGSTNVGTVAVLPQKIRSKDKVKLKERKLFAASKASLGMSNPGSPPDSGRRQQAIALPTAVDLDMEAKFKQSLMEDMVIGDKGIPRPPHRTVEVVGHVQVETGKNAGGGEKVPKSPQEASGQVSDRKEKSPEPEKCNLPDGRGRKSLDGLQEREKQLNSVVVTSGGRSPNSGSSGGQGEDSGIESMDALSEKSPNQASQSPHADIIPNVVVPKTQVPDILDIEAQLAKMEGLEPNQEESKGSITNAVQSSQSKDERSPNRTKEDVNENECIHRSDSKPCCDLTCTLQDDLNKSASKSPPRNDANDDIEPGNKGNAKKEIDLPTPNSPTLRVFSYPPNQVDKGGGGGDQDSRGGSESPMLTTTEDEDSNMATPLPMLQHANNKNKSLLEQLLIEIPSESTPNLHSPATRSSVRTRALSKLNSPELSSPVPKLAKAVLPPTTTAKRKRNESDSSNHSVDESRKRPRKGSEGSEVGKRLQNAAALKKSIKTSSSSNAQPQQDESSDSDEPLIEKLRKSAPKSAVKLVKNAAAVATTLQATPASQVNNKTNIRRSARAGQQQEKQQPAQNTRSREKVVQQQQHVGHHQQPPQAQQTTQNTNAEAEAAALRRKTRSADMESKRKKESVK